MLQTGQVGLYDRTYAGVDRAGAVLMGAARHEDIILSNTIHPHTIEEPVSSPDRRQARQPACRDSLVFILGKMKLCLGASSSVKMDTLAEELSCFNLFPVLFFSSSNPPY